MAAIITTAALTGLRRGELCALRWTDADLKAGTLTVTRSIWQTGSKWGVKDTKSHQGRTVHIGPRVVGTLRLVRRQQRGRANAAGVGLVDEAYVFSPDDDGADPKMPDVISQRFRQYCDALEATTADRWPYRFHDLRHYQASELIAAGVSMVTVSKRLGHSKVSTTSDIYAHDDQEHARAAAGALDAGLA